MKLYRKLIDYQIATTATTDAVARSSNALIDVIYYSTFKRAIYIFGRRIK